MTEAVRVTGPRKTALWHKWVRHHDVLEHLRLGWVGTKALEGTHHGDWSRHMVWLCECQPVEPKMPAQWERVA